MKLAPETLVSALRSWYDYNKSVLASSRKRTSMPNKYEREIEEILRNLERTEPKGGSGQRVNRRAPRKPGVSRGFSLPRLSFPEWCLLIALSAARSEEPRVGEE